MSKKRSVCEFDIMKVRNMVKEDCPYVAAIEAASFSLPWSEKSFEESLMQENYVAIVVTDESNDRDVLGYCCFNYVLDETEILNVCVREDRRGERIGQLLMEEAVARARKLGVSVMFLEVRQSNEPARKLYRKIGFSDLSIRKNFYEFPTEDAIVMQYFIK